MGLVSRGIILVVVCLAACASVPQQTAELPQKRLVVLGDSLAVGLFASSKTGGYAYQVAEAIGYDLDLLGGSHRNVCLVSDTWQAAADSIRADVIILEVGLNDIGDHLACLDESEWAEAYGELLDDLQASGARVVAVNIFWAGLPDWSEHYAKARRYNGYIADEAAQRGVEVVDIWSLTDGCLECLSVPEDSTPWPPYHGDNFHPGDYGHQVIAEAIVDMIMQRVYFPWVSK